jgi:anthranilate phosphoribosyltransferase
VLLNAAAALYVGGVVEDVRQGVTRAAELIDDGAAVRTLDSLRRESRDEALPS